jgi:hypothetical protein
MDVIDDGARVDPIYGGKGFKGRWWRRAKGSLDLSLMASVFDNRRYK